MLLVAGPTPEFLKFMQIVCWIVLPVLISAISLTVYFHYRKKKRNAGKEEELEERVIEASSGQVGYTNGNGEYVSFDHSALIQQYKDKISYNQARYTALQHDFANMEAKYAALASYAQTHFINRKKRPMENLPGQMPKHLQTDINKLAEEHAAEKEELVAKLYQLERSHQRMEDENRVLQDQIKMGTATDDERNAIINKWKEENTLLMDKIADKEYLEDLVDEKKAQVNFLQNQMEQRIKNLYQSEHERLKAINEMKQAKGEKEALESELLLKREHADKMQVVLCEKEEQLTEKQQILNSKIEHITQLENMLREAKEQNESLNTLVADNRKQIGALQQQLSDEQSKVQFLTQKLFANKQMMRRVYKEFSTFIDDSGEGSPVIPLRAEYGNKESEETAVR